MSDLRADLHIHTYFSDGLFSPEEVAREAAANGVNLIAVTDHDTCLATKAVKAECAKRNIKAVAGIEVSAYVGDLKLHTLGYNVDAENPDFARFLSDLYEGSLKRAEDIIFKLNRAGVAIKFEEAAEFRASENAPLHAMHIARACVKKGYANSPFTFYKKYLAFGGEAYSKICRPTPEQTVEVIAACGGFSSLAHPGRIETDAATLNGIIKKMKACGLCGIEAVYSTHTVTETAYYKELANAYGLTVTGGSDTHYSGGSRKIGTPEFHPSETLVGILDI